MDKVNDGVVASQQEPKQLDTAQKLALTVALREVAEVKQLLQQKTLQQDAVVKSLLEQLGYDETHLLVIKNLQQGIVTVQRPVMADLEGEQKKSEE